MANKRDVNIELLRIVAMIFIVLLHALGKSIILDNVELFSFNYYFAYVFEGIAFCGVNIFMLITGYYSKNSKFHFRKILNIIAEVLFYTVIIYFVLLATGYIQFNSIDLVYTFFPTMTRHYWYISIYVLAYFLLPFLNRFESLSERAFRTLLIVLFVFFSLIPTVIFFVDTFDINNGYSLLWYVFMILIGKYFKKYPFKIDKLRKKSLCVYIISTLLIPISRFVIAHGGVAFVGKVVGAGLFYRYNSVLVLISSVSLFQVFLTIHIDSVWPNKLISYFAPCTLGVYLIHTNRFLKDIVWDIFFIDTMLNKWILIPWIVVSVLIVFAICSFIDKIRTALFKIIFKSKLINKACSSFEEKYITE